MKFRVFIIPVSGASALKARAEVTVILDGGEEIIMRDFRIIQKQGAPPWVGGPQLSFFKNGKTQFKELIRFNQLARKTLFSRIIAEFERLTKV